MTRKLLLASVVLLGASVAWAAQQVRMASFDNGSVTASNLTPAAGEVVTLTATPDAGYTISADDITVEYTLGTGNAELPRRIKVGMFATVTATDNDNEFQFTMPDEPYNVLVSATFNKIPTYTVTIADGIENGTVTADKAEATEGETVTLTVTPADTYKLDNLTVAGEQGSVATTRQADGTYTFAMPAENVTVAATFKQDTYKVTVLSGIENGTVTVDPTEYVVGATVTVTITPAAGYELDVLKINDDDQITFVIDDGGDDEGGSGGYVDAPRRAVRYSHPVEFTLNEAGTEATFTMPKANVEVTATFKQMTVVLDGVVFDTDREYATWCGDTDLALPAGVEAYVVSAVEGDQATITAIDYIPANTAVLLHSAVPATEVTTVPGTGTATEVTNLLVGAADDMEIAEDIYVLYADGFVLAYTGTLPAHRCYLPSSVLPASAPARLRIVAANDPVTAVSDIKAAASGAVKYVNLAGQVSDRPFTGVNIVVNADGTVTKIVK